MQLIARFISQNIFCPNLICVLACAKYINVFTFNENDPENKNTVGIRVATRNQLKAEATTWNDIYIPVNLEQIQTDDPDHETKREQKRPDFHQIQT